MLSPPPSPELVLTASPDGQFTTYDPHSGTVVGRFNGNRCPRNGICTIGNHLFAASHVSPETGAGSVCMYYWWSTSCTRNVSLPEPVAPLAASVDGLYVFSGGISGQIHSVSANSGEVIRSFSVHETAVSCLAINCDGSLVLSGGDDGTIAILPILLLINASFETESRYSRFSRFAGHESSVTGLTTAVGRSGGVMVSSSLDCTCKIWSLVSGLHLQTVRFPGEIWCTVLDPSETELFAAGIDGMIYKRKVKVERRKQVEGGKTVAWGGMQGGGVVAMELLSYGRVLLTVSENGEICEWEVENGNMIRGFGEKSGGVSGVVVAKGGGAFGKRGVGSGECGGYVRRKEVGRALVEMKEALKVAVEDRSRAISKFEEAIESNEKMLKLMLKEAKAISKSNE